MVISTKFERVLFHHLSFTDQSFVLPHLCSIFPLSSVPRLLTVRARWLVHTVYCTCYQELCKIVNNLVRLHLRLGLTK